MAAKQFTVEDDRYQQDPPVRSTNWMKGCLLGCLGVVILALILGTVATIWITRNWRGIAANSMSTVIKQSIDASNLPVEEKEQVKVEVDRGANLFRDGKISGEQATMLVQKAMNSPLMTAIIASGAEKQYLDRSGLSDEEKAEARVTLSRFIRGTIDEKIDRQSADAAMRHVSDPEPNNQWRFRPKVSDAELRAFLTEAKKAADAAQIPEQVESIDPSDEVKRIIDETIADLPVEPAPPIDVPPMPENPPEPEATN